MPFTVELDINGSTLFPTPPNLNGNRLLSIGIVLSIYDTASLGLALLIWRGLQQKAFNRMLVRDWLILKILLKAFCQKPISVSNSDPWLKWFDV